MSGMLKAGTQLRTTKNVDVRVDSFLGSGGQGEVYKVTVDGRPEALKWYFPQAATDEQRRIVTELVNQADMQSDRFLWPEALVVRDGDTRSFGYVMPLRPERFAGLPDLFARRVVPKPRELITACLLVVEAYQTLHRKGIAYRDISWGNVFFESNTGEVLICDNDNAVFEGRSTGIEGTLEFMAPELVRGDADAAPGVQTDLHALAVLLFLILVNHHPLEGARELKIHCMDEKAKKLLYGKEPIFIFDPGDPRNKADEYEQGHAIAMWNFLPVPVRNLFVESFTTGLRSPEGRVREGEWIEALSRCRDGVVTCRHCDRQNLVDLGGKVSGGDFGTCWQCDVPLTPYAALKIEAPTQQRPRMLLLDPESRVYAHHLAGVSSSHDFQQIRAEVRRHPQRPDQLGLTNLSDKAWDVASGPDEMKEVPPGKSVTMRDGQSIMMGPVKATVRVYR